VIHVQDENPQYPEEHPDFWNIWKRTIENHHPEKIDVLFSSELYGDNLSKILKCSHICIDLDRKRYPISGTKIRENPIANWEFLPNKVRSYFTKRIVITGPESTGKTTLSRNLAKEFQTIWVPEFAREYLESRGNSFFYEDIEEICKGHIRSEDSLLSFADRFLFIDTDPIITKMYSALYFGKVPEFVELECTTRKYDLHLLLTPDVPWVADPLRDFPERREEFLQNLIQNLHTYNQKFVLISGNFVERLERAKSIISSMFGLS
jgi:NadR type nicotinamide-nucleotide adenylyltransferase